MLQLVLIFCLSVSVRADPAGQRAVGWFTTGDYNTKFTDGSKKLLAAYNVANKNMVRDKSVSPKSETIGWTQILQCFFGCEEEYLLTDYYQDGEKTNPVMKVFVAKSKLSPPDEFNTSGYKKLLHFFSTMEVRIKPSFLFSIPTSGNPTSTGSRPMPSQSSSMPVLVPSSQVVLEH